MKHSRSLQNKQEQLEGIVTILIEEVENITDYLQNGIIIIAIFNVIRRYLFRLFKLQ